VRPFLHLLSVVLVLPSVALACLFIVLGRAIATHSLLGLFGELLVGAVWLIPAVFVMLVIAIAGIVARSRWLAGLSVAALGIGSTMVVLAMSANNSNVALGQTAFLLPGLVASGIGLWFAVSERPGRHNATSAA
jgi:hypothetical protein